MTFSMSGTAGIGLHAAGLATPAPGSGFRGEPRHARIRDAFRRIVRGRIGTSRPDDEQTLRCARNLSALAPARRARTGEQDSAVTFAERRAESTGKPITERERLQALAAAIEGIVHQLDAAELARLAAAEPPSEAEQTAAVAREAAARQDIQAALDEGRRLVARLGGGMPRIFVEAAVRLALPAAASNAPRASAERAATVDALIDLDQRFAEIQAQLDAARPGDRSPGYTFDRLLSVLCNQARIRELGSSDAKGAVLSLTGLHGLVELVNDSVRPGRDGYELNFLVGFDAGLDNVIQALRTECVAEFMVEQAAREGNGAKRAELMRSAAGHAAELVKGEMDIARTRLQLVRALKRAGVEQSASLVGAARADAVFLKGLARVLNDPRGIGDRLLNFAHARGLASDHRLSRKVGLVVGRLLAQERSLVNSDAGKRMLADVASRRQGLSAAVDGEAATEKGGLTQLGVDDHPPMRFDNAGATFKREIRSVADMRTDILRLTQREKALSPQGLDGVDLQPWGIPTGPDKTLDQALETASMLAGRGLSSIDEADAALGRINKVVATMKRTGVLKSLFEGGFQVLGAGTDDAKARRLAELLRVKAAGVNGAHLLSAEQADKLRATAAEYRDAAAAVCSAGRRLADHDEIDRKVPADFMRFAPLALRRRAYAKQRGRERGELVKSLRMAKTGLDALVAERARVIAGAGHEFRTAARSAILLQLGDTPLHAFRPHEHAAAVEAALSASGFDVELWKPEIETMLAQGCGPEQLARWRDEAGLARDLAGTDSTADPLDSQIDRMAHRTTLVLVAGRSLQVQSWSVPVDPAMIASVKASAEAARADVLMVEKDFDGGYFLYFISGTDGGVAASASAGTPLSQQFGVGGQVTGTLGAKGHWGTGVAMSFPDAAAMKEMLHRLRASEPAATADLTHSDSILPVGEGSVSGRVAAGAAAGFNAGVFFPQSRHASPTAGGGVTAALEHKRGRVAGRNNDVELSVVSKTTQAGVSVGGSIAAVVATPGMEDGPHAAGFGVAAGGASLARVSTDKTKVVTGSGRLLTGERQVIGRHLGGEGFEQLMKRLQRKNPGAFEAIRALRPGLNEQFIVTSKLASDMKVVVTDLLTQADAERRKMNAHGARALESRAHALARNPAHYVIASVGVMPFIDEVKAGAVDLGFVRTEKFSATSSQHYAAEVMIDEEDAAAVRDEMLGIERRTVLRRALPDEKQVSHEREPSASSTHSMGRSSESSVGWAEGLDLPSGVDLRQITVSVTFDTNEGVVTWDGSL